MDEPLFLPLISDLLDFADSLDDKHTTAGIQNTQNIINDSSDKESQSKEVQDVGDAHAVGGETEIIELDSISETFSYGGADSIKDETAVNDKDDASDDDDDDDDRVSNLSAIPDESVESMVTFSTPSKKKNTNSDDEMTRIVIFHRPSVDISRPPSPSKYSRNSVIEFRQPIISKEEKRRIKRRKQNKRNNKKRRSLQLMLAKNMIDKNSDYKNKNRNSNRRYNDRYNKNRYNNRNNRNNSRYRNNHYNRFRRNRFSRFRYNRRRIVYKRLYIDRSIKERMEDDAMNIKEYRKNAYARKRRASLKGDEKLQLRYKKNRRNINNYSRELEERDCESKISKRQKYRQFAEIIKTNVERRDMNRYSRVIRRERKKRLYEEYLVRCEQRKKRHQLWLEREKIRQEKRKQREQREQMRRIVTKRRPSYLYWKKDEWYRQSLS